MHVEKRLKFSSFTGNIKKKKKKKETSVGFFLSPVAFD
jgi:hypothetical protein